MYYKFNFFKYTYCEFESKKIDFFEGKSAHYQSKSGSLYFYADDGVYRYSNHWGRVANCRWKIKGVENYKSQNYYVGFAKWIDFYPLNDFDKVFYLEVDFNKQQARIKRIGSVANTDKFLMTSEFVHQRLKQIQTLFKEYKWAKYFDDDIDVVRKKLILGLVTSNKAIQQLKQQL
ncbi:hypothetical protein H3Z83_08225 [Tenacibaculum sp. S7007]|uniref:Uncharacterized protein n=1 Tax=Tenacibaculum pelagium TaxID=2759527 RepID=A0A839APR1_9FLAO|nr:hypothetical protein [Tenacibaculum pelagium]MBA6156496.1 hypothetical protein [Tenacibaculum pelagium]